MLFGAALHFLLPTKYSATTNLYLTQPPGSDLPLSMADDTALLHSRAVADRAISELGLHTTADQFLADYQGFSLSDAIMSIRVTGPSQAETVLWDNSLAQAFLYIRNEEIRIQTNALLDGYQAQIASDETDINNLTASINALPAAPTSPRTLSHLDDMLSQRSNDISQVGALQTLVQADSEREISVANGSHVLDFAEVGARSTKKAVVMDALSGLIGGLGLAIGVIAVGAMLSERPRRRIDVVATLGAPIGLSLDAPPRTWWRLRRQMKRPSPALSRAHRRLKDTLEAAPGFALAVVAIDDVKPAAITIALLAQSLSSEQRRVLLVDMTTEHALASLLGVRRSQNGRQELVLGDQQITLLGALDSATPAAEDVSSHGTDAVLVLANADPAYGADHIHAWARTAVVMLTAGKSSYTRIRTAGQLLRQAGITVKEAILVGADKDDDTTGLLESVQIDHDDNDRFGVLRAAPG
jgi:capsular polysaccharide biosynthesis protein